MGITVNKGSKKKRNPSWERDELILALDCYFNIKLNQINRKHDEIINLVEILNSLPIHQDRTSYKNFRNSNSVIMKLQNFRRLDPNNKGKALQNGSILEEEIWNEFYNDKTRLHNIAQSIVAGINEGTVIKANDIEEEEFPEGKILYRIHKKRERNNKIIKKKKQIAFERNELKCEICAFDFFEVYGEHGKGFIECHHTIPVSSYKKTLKLS